MRLIREFFARCLFPVWGSDETPIRTPLAPTPLELSRLIHTPRCGMKVAQLVGVYSVRPSFRTTALALAIWFKTVPRGTPRLTII